MAAEAKEQDPLYYSRFSKARTGISAGANVDRSISEGQRHAISVCSVGCGFPDMIRAWQGMRMIEIVLGEVSVEEDERA
jgi:hypothetical protein